MKQEHVRTDAEPLYEHDCKSCIFLGALIDYDLYYCGKQGDITVIARYSDEPSEYLSGWGTMMSPLLIAEALYWRKQGRQ